MKRLIHEIKNHSEDDAKVVIDRYVTERTSSYFKLLVGMVLLLLGTMVTSTYVVVKTHQQLNSTTDTLQATRDTCNVFRSEVYKMINREVQK